jgi:hypothetical protein
MKLTTALTKLKNLKSQLARVDGYINESVVHYEGDEPEHNFVAETENRSKLINEIRSLKGRIMAANIATIVDVGDKKTSIADLVLFNAELRSELAHWSKLLAVKAEENHHFSARTKDTVKKVYAAGYNKLEIKAKLNQLEKSKEQVEAFLMQANMETDLLS